MSNEKMMDTVKIRTCFLANQGHPRALVEVLRAHPDLVVLLDGTERPVRRPDDDDAQRRNHSGKKKRHSCKNLVVTAQRRVLCYRPQSA